jgi:hypothetical protein
MAAERNFVGGNTKGDLVESFFHAGLTSIAILTSGRAAFTATERFEHVHTAGCLSACAPPLIRLGNWLRRLHGSSCREYATMNGS